MAPIEPDVLAIIRTMMESQSAANVAMSMASNANMIAFHTATAQALAVKNGDKDSKLTVAKKKNPPSVLRACGERDLHDPGGVPGHGRGRGNY